MDNPKMITFPLGPHKFPPLIAKGSSPPTVEMVVNMTGRKRSRTACFGNRCPQILASPAQHVDEVDEHDGVIDDNTRQADNPQKGHEAKKITGYPQSDNGADQTKGKRQGNDERLFVGVELGHEYDINEHEGGNHDPSAADERFGSFFGFAFLFHQITVRQGQRAGF